MQGHEQCPRVRRSTPSRSTRGRRARKHVTFADAAVQVGSGSAAATSYLDADVVLAAARATGADCIHPVPIPASRGEHLFCGSSSLKWKGTKHVDGGTAIKVTRDENKKTNPGYGFLSENAAFAALRRGGYNLRRAHGRVRDRRHGRQDREQEASRRRRA